MVSRHAEKKESLLLPELQFPTLAQVPFASLHKLVAVRLGFRLSAHAVLPHDTPRVSSGHDTPQLSSGAKCGRGLDVESRHPGSG